MAKLRVNVYFGQIGWLPGLVRVLNGDVPLKVLKEVPQSQPSGGCSVGGEEGWPGAQRTDSKGLLFSWRFVERLWYIQIQEHRPRALHLLYVSNNILDSCFLMSLGTIK